MRPALLLNVDEQHLALFVLLALLAALVGPIPGLDFVAQMGWMGALVGGVIAYLRWRRDPQGVSWPAAVLLATLAFVGLGVVVQILSELL